MPNPNTLKIGDRICIICIPENDLQAFESGSSYLLETINVLKWMIGKEFTVSWIDADGKPWVEVDYPDSSGAQHSVAIMDQKSWLKV